jgi:hypothetical protein
MLETTRDDSPLARLCKEDPGGYRTSFDALALERRRGTAPDGWAEPLSQPISLYRILQRWILLDVVEAIADPSADQVHLMRAEVLAHFARLDGNPEAAAWVEWHLGRIETLDGWLRMRVEQIRGALEPDRQTVNPMAAARPSALIGAASDGTVVLAGREGVREIDIRQVGAQCTCTLSDGAFIVLGFADGNLIRMSRDGSITRHIREEGTYWAGLATIIGHREGATLAAVTAIGEVVLFESESLDAIERFRAVGMQPTAVTAAGSHLWIASAQGFLRRYELKDPVRAESFLATPDRAEFTVLCRLDDGGLIALTSSGEALAYQSGDPARLPTRLSAEGERLVSAEPYDELHALLGSDTGSLSLMSPSLNVRSSLEVQLDAGLLCVMRLDDVLLSVHSTGIILRSEITGRATVPALAPPRTLYSGRPFEAAFSL